MKRHYTLLDTLLIKAENSLKTVFGEYHAHRPNPSQGMEEGRLTVEEKKEAAGLMRVNHAGEVCAQALYEGQQWVSRTPEVRKILVQAAQEEMDHLSWSDDRLKALQSHRSYLNLFWYWNSFFIGTLAALGGDARSLGFLEETEKQVEQHFQWHLKHLPEKDIKSRRVIEQMCADEMHHKISAQQAGAQPLPSFVKVGMKLVSKVMTTLAYYV